MTKPFPYLVAAASAFLVSLSFPSFDLGIFAWFGLSPLLFVLRQQKSLVAAATGYLFGVVFWVVPGFWIPKVLTFDNFLIVVFFFSLFYLVFGFIYRLICKRIGFWIILGAPALWVTLEYVRCNISFLSWPWNLVGHSQYRYLPIIQIADITGVYGISFLIVMVNQLLSEVLDIFIERRGPSALSNPQTAKTKFVAHISAVVLALGVTLVYGWYKLSLPESENRLRVALVQANVLTWDNMPVVDQEKHLQAYEGLTREVAVSRPDLIVWPSSSLPAPIRYSRLVNFNVRRLAIETKSYLLVGGAGMDKFGPSKDGFLPFSNTEFLIAPNGRIVAEYNKIRLLPFNEYLPLQGIITWPEWITSLKKSFVAGEEYTLFEVSGEKFGTPICWENMFPDLFSRFVKEGAHFMVSVTNEGFFKQTAAPYQSLAMNAFRAVENRVAVVRSAATGISAFINSNGEIVERVQNSDGKDLFVSGILIRDIPVSKSKSFYTIYGDIFAYFAIIFAVLMIVVSLLRKRVP